MWLGRRFTGILCCGDRVDDTTRKETTMVIESTIIVTTRRNDFARNSGSPRFDNSALK